MKLRPGFQANQVLGRGSDEVFGRWRVQRVPPGRTAEEMVSTLLTRPGVEAAELDYRVQLDSIFNPRLFAHSASVTVDDEYLSYQWHLPAVEVADAWAHGTGSGVVVAVVDTGVSQEGDDLGCHTFVAPYNAITQAEGLSAATDGHGHGTHIAGTIAQCTDNGVGVAGIAFDSSLMPVKVLNEDGWGWVSDIAEGIEWARTHGADVINLSLGSHGQSSALDETIEAAVNDGIVVVAASGNHGIDLVSYPARHPEVIAVGATDFDNDLASYSNTGDALDVVAPGGSGQDENADGHPDGILQETFCNAPPSNCPSLSGSNGWGYYFISGTSMATAHVSGAVALILSRHPGVEPIVVKHALEETALDLGPSGRDDSFGHGLIQIHQALDADFTPPAWSLDAAITVTAYGETSLGVSWDGADDDRGVTDYELKVDGETWAVQPGRSAVVTGLDPATRYEFQVLARDEAGNVSDPIVAFLQTARAFTDTPGTTFYEDILWMSGKDITRGCNPPVNDMFCPDDPVTRGQMAAFIVRMLGLTEDSGVDFVDVAETYTFAADIGKLATAGITRGCNPPTNDMFCPDDPVTRGQMAAFIVRMLGLTEDSGVDFVDVAQTSTFAADIGKLATAGITRGCNPPTNDMFCPNDPVTRGELAAFLHRSTR